MTVDYQWIVEFGIELFTVTSACPIYIIFLYMIVRFGNLAQFDNPFYHLVFQCGLLDLWYIIHQYLYVNLLIRQVLVNLAPEFLDWANVPLVTGSVVTIPEFNLSTSMITVI